MENRAIQVEILKTLYKIWNGDPVGYCGNDILMAEIGVDDIAIKRNLLYLEEIGKIEISKIPTGNREDIVIIGSKITASGIDFVDASSPFNPDPIKLRIENLDIDARTKEEALEALSETVDFLKKAKEKSGVIEKLGTEGRNIAIELLAAVARGLIFGQ